MPSFRFFFKICLDKEALEGGVDYEVKKQAGDWEKIKRHAPHSNFPHSRASTSKQNLRNLFIGDHKKKQKKHEKSKPF